MENKKFPQMVTVKEASKETGLPEYLIRKLCITKKVKAIKSGKKYYLNADSLMRFLTDEKEVSK